MIGEFVNFWTDTRYCRERDHEHLLLTHGPAAAIAGLLLQDAKLLRLGTRYALSIAHCDHWDDDLVESLENTILPDGGYVEGPTYFRCVARDGGLSIFHYARGRKREFRSVIPASMARTATFGAAIASTDEDAEMDPGTCDYSSPVADLVKHCERHRFL